MLPEAISGMATSQTTQQAQTSGSPERIQEVVEQIKVETEVPVESSRPVETTVRSSINDNLLRFNVLDEGVQTRVLSSQGELLKTIPPSDITDILRANALPSVGNLIDRKV